MTIYDVSIIPLIVGIVELLKQVGLPSKFAAVVSVILGIAIGVVYVSPDDVKKGILVGLALGLAASGLYSGTKSTVEGVKGLFSTKGRDINNPKLTRDKPKLKKY